MEGIPDELDSTILWCGPDLTVFPLRWLDLKSWIAWTCPIWRKIPSWSREFLSSYISSPGLWHPIPDPGIWYSESWSLPTRYWKSGCFCAPMIRILSGKASKAGGLTSYWSVAVGLIPAQWWLDITTNARSSSIWFLKPGYYYESQVSLASQKKWDCLVDAIPFKLIQSGSTLCFIWDPFSPYSINWQGLQIPY